MTDENNVSNPLDQMDDSQPENGGAASPDADQRGDAAANAAGQVPTTPEAPAPEVPPAPAPAAPAAPTAPVAPAPAPSSPEAPLVPPQNVAPRMPSPDRIDDGIMYGKRKSEIAEKLKKQERVAFMIPRTDGEAAELSYETVQINGHRMEIKKGMMVYLPKQVADILAEKYRIQLEAGSDKLIGRSEDIMNRLT